MKLQEKIPYNRAILLILLSTLLISGITFMGWLYFLHVRELRIKDEQYQIVAIIQSTSQRDVLKTAYFAEFLNLSMDRPINLYEFNVEEGRKILLANSLIKSASIKKIFPGTLFIQYELRKPVAFVGNFANTVIDEEGFLFPFKPFFTPKKIPKIFLALEKENYSWGDCLKQEMNLQLAFDLMGQFSLLSQNQFYLKQVDVAQAKTDSFGQRQIVVVLEKIGEDLASTSKQSSFFLRLNTDSYLQDLVNFSTLVKEHSLDKEEMVIDLRIPHLAFIKPMK